MTIERCPYCKQPLKGAKEPPQPLRTCFDCGDPITRMHRYTFQRREDVSVAVTVHRSCEYPYGYFSLAEAKRRGVYPYSVESRDVLDRLEQEARERCAERGWDFSLDLDS